MDATLNGMIEQRNTAQQTVNDLTRQIAEHIHAQQRELSAVLDSVGITGSAKVERRGRYRRTPETTSKASEAMRRRWAAAKANGTRVNVPSNGAVQ